MPIVSVLLSAGKGLNVEVRVALIPLYFPVPPTNLTLTGVVSFGPVASAYHHRHQPKVAMILQLSRRSDIQRRPSRIPIMRQAAPVNAKAMNGCSRTKAAL